MSELNYILVIIMEIVQNTANASLIIQVITGIMDFYILTLNIPKPYLILRELLILEFIVQIVEGSFYVWLTTSFNFIENITPYRYYDWYISTPTMLITFCIYLIYLRNQEKKTLSDNDRIDTTDNFFKIIKQNIETLTYIIILNAMMLTFGLMNELNMMDTNSAVFCGFIPFILMFISIYDNYAKHTKLGITIFKYFSGIWSLYGVAALMSYQWKNALYNILDLFAKNFFGIYLAYILWVVSRIPPVS